MSVDLTGKTIIITGGNGGIGKATAVALAKMGATIVIAGRESEKTNQAIEEIKQESSNTKISNMALDLSDLQSVRNFTKEVKALDLPIDVLINNAGVNYMHYNETKDGFESNMGINHLGHFLLTMELLPLLIKNKSRVVVLSSGLYKQKRTINFNALRSKEEFSIMAYAESKLANLLFVKEFHRRYNDKGIRIYAVHPGVIRTDLARNTFLNKASFLLNYPPFSWIWKSPEEGSLTSVYCASSPDLEGVSGKYYESSKEVNTNSVANNEELAKKLWQVSEQMVGLNS